MKIRAIIVLIILGIGACGCVANTPPAAPPGVPSSMPPDGSPEDILNASVPDLIGRWSGLTIGHVQGDGFYTHDTGIYTITEQEGYAFAGYKEYLRPDGKLYYENFSGAITPGGEIIIADSVKGFSTGWLTGPDSMELLYGEDGAQARAFVQFFTRQKQ